jgi:ADP-heptose:LPS heptosyltransferase
MAVPIGRAKQTATFWYDRFLTIPGELYGRQHMSENYLWAWRAVGVELEDSPHVLAVPEDFKQEAGKRVAGTNWTHVERESRLMVHVGTRSDARRWPLESFAAALKQLAEGDDPMLPAIVGGPGDEAVIEALQRMLPEAVSFGIVKDVRLLAALFAEAADFVGHDSGPAHLAAGLGLRITTLATAPELRQWRPLAESARVIAAPNPCPQCLAPGVCVPGDSYRMCCIRHVSVGMLVHGVRSQRG